MEHNDENVRTFAWERDKERAGERENWQLATADGCRNIISASAATETNYQIYVYHMFYRFRIVE